MVKDIKYPINTYIEKIVVAVTVLVLYEKSDKKRVIINQIIRCTAVSRSCTGCKMNVTDRDSHDTDLHETQST